MPRQAPDNAEPVLVSPEDEDVFNYQMRRSFNPDGSMRYVQLIATPADLQEFGSGIALDEEDDDEDDNNPYDVKVAVGLPRLIAHRMLGRPLEPEEVVLQKNGLKGDCRRENVEISTKSEQASGARPEVQWGASGVKYVYQSSNGRYFVNYKGRYVGSFSTVEAASEAIVIYEEAVAGGMDELTAAKYARRKVKFGKRK